MDGPQQAQEAAQDECWICLSSGSQALCRPCECPRSVHRQCLARWQLQQSGRREETHCRFCQASYGDWRAALVSRLPERPPTPTMAIMFEGTVHRIKVHPGPEGRARFEAEVRRLIHLGDEEEFEIEFQCKSPFGGGSLKLGGLGAFDAATHCAALTAAERLTRRQQKQQQQQQQQQQQGQQGLPQAQQQQESPPTPACMPQEPPVPFPTAAAGLGGLPQ